MGIYRRRRQALYMYVCICICIYIYLARPSATHPSPPSCIQKPEPVKDKKVESKSIGADGLDENYDPGPGDW